MLPLPLWQDGLNLRVSGASCISPKGMPPRAHKHATFIYSSTAICSCCVPLKLLVWRCSVSLRVVVIVVVFVVRVIVVITEKSWNVFQWHALGFLHKARDEKKS